MKSFFCKPQLLLQDIWVPRACSGLKKIESLLMWDGSNNLFAVSKWISASLTTAFHSCLCFLLPVFSRHRAGMSLHRDDGQAEKKRVIRSFGSFTGVPNGPSRKA